MSVAVQSTQVLEEVLQRIASDLSMIADRELVIGSVECEDLDYRPAGLGQIHISFRLGFKRSEEWFAGCLLMPLPDAICLSGCLLMLPEEEIVGMRDQTTLDGPPKEAILEVGNFLSSATDAGLKSVGIEDVKVVFDGCQGVRPDIRPAMAYDEGAVLHVARAKATLRDFPEQTYLLLLPATALVPKED